MLCPFPLPALRSLGEGGSFIEGEGIQLCRVRLTPPIVIPAKPVLSKVEGAGIQMPSFTGEVIFAQIRKLALDTRQPFMNRVRFFAPTVDVLSKCIMAPRYTLNIPHNTPYEIRSCYWGIPACRRHYHSLSILWSRRQVKIRSIASCQMSVVRCLKSDVGSRKSGRPFMSF